jgi:hypothetical protein
MTPLAHSESLIKTILDETRTIAVVGASANPARPSYGVMRWLLSRGYRVSAINPGLSGTLLDAPVYPRLADVPEAIDMVDIFRNSEAAGAVVDEALALPQKPRVIWMQLGVINEAAAARAEAAGVTVIMDRCPVIESAHLERITHGTSDLRW